MYYTYTFDVNCRLLNVAERLSIASRAEYSGHIELLIKMSIAIGQAICEMLWFKIDDWEI